MFELTPQELKINHKTYQIVSELGAGSFGKVVLTICKNDNQRYAIKIQETLSEGEYEFYQKILKNNTKFKNVVNIFDIQRIGKQQYIVMDSCESSLYQQIVKNQFDKKNIRYCMKEIANGIRELHDLGLTHRDIKPENILIQTLTSKENLKQQVYKICDFGTMKRSENLMTQKIGTPYYIAPEQLNNASQSYSNKVDIWAFGALSYELLTGQPLFDGQTLEQIQYEILNQDIQGKINKLTDIQGQYKILLKQMLERDHAKRYDIASVIKELGPISRSVSRQKNNSENNSITAQNPPKTSIRGNYFQQPQSKQERGRSFGDQQFQPFVSDNLSERKQPQNNKNINPFPQFQPNYRQPQNYSGRPPNPMAHQSKQLIMGP